MPLPKPKKDEEQGDFINRCMGNPTMLKDYPDDEQRAGVCYSQWRDSKKKNKINKSVESAMPKDTKRKYRLSNINVQEVAFASVPAVPEAVIAVTKSLGVPEGSEIIGKSISFAKTDAVKKQVFAYALVPELVDKQGHIANEEEVEKACHSLMRNFAARMAKGSGSSVDHTIFDPALYPIESAIDIDGSLGKALGFANPFSKAWLIGLQANDEVWDKIQKGEITGISIGGTALLKEVETDDADDGQHEEGGIIKAVKDGFNRLLTLVSKGEGDAISYDEAKLLSELKGQIWRQQDQLYESIQSILGDGEVTDKAQAVAQSIDQFKTDMIALVSKLQTIRGGQQKKTLNMKGEDDMTKEELQNLTKSITDEVTKALDEKLQKVDALDERLKVFEDAKKAAEDAAKEADGGGDGGDGGDDKPTVESLTKEIAEMAKGLKDMTERLATVEKTPGTRKGDTEVTHPQPPKTPEELEKADEQKAGAAILGFGGK